MPFLSRKKKGEATGGSTKKSGPIKNKSYLTRRQSEKCRNRQQDQELLAQQDPEPRFDLSSCELTEVPPGVFAVCKVLQKQILLLQDNWLRSLAGGGDLIDLKFIRVLDLHNNDFKSLPDDFGCLTHLQVVDLSSNSLQELPGSFDGLQSLQTLNLRSNQFTSLPSPILKLRYLRTLDISHNEIEELPVNLCYVKALETLILDNDKMRFPPQDICKKSTAALMMFLCGQAEIEFEHPSKYWAKVDSANKGLTSSASDGFLSMSQIESQMMEGVQAYQNVLDQKRKDAQDVERYLCAEQEEQTMLATRAAEEHRRMLTSITKHQEQDSCDFAYLNSRKDMEKREFLKLLKELESGASSLLSQLLDYNSKAKETEKLMEIMDDERMKENDWLTVRWEEVQNLRKQEILDNMEVMLREFDSLEAARVNLEIDKDETRRDAIEQENLDVGQIESLIHHKHLEHEEAVDKLSKEDELQKVAFEALLYSQDATHSRLRSQITLIESELAQITAVEMDQRSKRLAHELNVMADHRVALSAMLSQLLEEKEKRQVELKKRLVEMELQREAGQQDYWLVQYQRLLDWKPQSLIDRESKLEIAVKEILITAGAEDYLPVFAKHRITTKTLMALTDADLRQMGVHELGLRRNILKQIDYQHGDLGSSSPGEETKILRPIIPPSDVTPSAPPESVHLPPEATPSAPPESVYLPPELPSALLEKQLTVTARGLNSECAICLDRQSSIIFLTCGHVCCCSVCAQPIKECPLCRTTISAKVKLYFPRLDL